MAALQPLRRRIAFAAACALPWARIHHFHCVSLFPGCSTGPQQASFNKKSAAGAARLQATGDVISENASASAAYQRRISGYQRSG
jgi:hypothetical protein